MSDHPETAAPGEPFPFGPVRITGISICEGERKRAIGAVARFSFDLGPMRVRGCAPILVPGGQPLATMPRCRSDSASARFADHATRLQITAAALDALQVLGGTLPARDRRPTQGLPLGSGGH